MSPRALVVAYCFPPHAAIGTHRALRLVRHLSANGWAVDVLTAEPRAYLPGTHVDEQLLNQVPPGIRVIRSGAFRGFTRVGRLIQSWKRSQPREIHGSPVASRPGTGDAAPTSALRNAKALVEELCAMPDKDVGWLFPAFSRGLRASIGSPPDVIFSSAPPWSTHLVASMLATRLGSRWVADFRDPWVRSPWSRYRTHAARTLATRLERHVIHQADAVLFTTEATREEFAQHYGSTHGARFHTVANGCDADEFAGIVAEPPKEQFVLLHAGSLYGGRSPLPLLRAVAALRRDTPIAADRLRVRFLGSTTFPGIDLPRVCADLGLAPQVEFVPRVERRESLAEMRRASALVILQAGTAMAIPGKLYEYLAAGRPLLALCEEGEIGRLIRAQSVGLVVPPHDEAAIQQALMTLLTSPTDRWQRADRATYDGDMRAAEMRRILEAALASAATTTEASRLATLP